MKHTINIDCDDNIDCKKLTVRGDSEKNLDEFVTILNKFFNKNFKVEYKYIKKKQTNFIEKCQYYDMPEYIINNNMDKYPFFFIIYKKHNPLLKKFGNIINITINEKTPFLWYKKKPLDLSPFKNMMYIDTLNIKPKYPIYIISKGRWEKRLTSKYLEWIGVDYRIVIEPQEFENYNKYIDKNKILILPNEYLNKNQGGIPARNFVLNHSKNEGAKRHWILDDNIDGYYRTNESEKVLCKSGAVFRVIEDYIDRYENVKMAGHNYNMFVVSTSQKDPITYNTRIYSSILLSNDIPFEWRGKYNEDTDLSLRILKAGYPTVLFNSFTAKKMTTLTQKGGNTDTIYNEKNALYLKAKSLKDQHPDVTIIKERFGRVHHYVNYLPFKNNFLIMKKNLKIPHKINNYGLKLVKKENYKEEEEKEEKKIKKGGIKILKKI